MRATGAFIAVLMLALGVFLSALYVHSGAPWGPAWLPTHLPVPVVDDFLAYFGWLAGLLVLFVSAWGLRGGGLDLTVASEFMVVYGIFGLLLSLASGVFVAAPEIDAESAELRLEILRPILVRFAEGLSAAGTAPLFAVLLRLIDSSAAREDGMDDATAAYNALKAAADSARLSIVAYGTEFKKSIEAATAAANGLTKALEGSGKGVGVELGTALKALQGINEELQKLASGSHTAGENMGELATNASTAKQMLTALGEAIDKVTNFVRGL